MIFLALLAAAAPAVELRLETLFLPARATYGGAPLDAPIYQWLELTGRDLGPPGLSAHAAVWGFAAIGSGGDEVTGKPLSGDVDILYLEYSHPSGGITARAGRQLAFGAPGLGYLAQFDGGSLRLAWRALSLEAFGGATVQRRFARFGQYDWVAGGRAGYHLFGAVNAGVSFLEARTEGAEARETAGADVAVAFGDHADAAVSLAYDLIDRGVLEARALVRFEPLDRLTIGAGAEQGSPGRMIDKTSIFSVFALGDYGELSVFAQYALSRGWVAQVRYARVYLPGEGGEGLGDGMDRAGASVTAAPLERWWVTAEGERLFSGANGYTSARVAVRWVPADRWRTVLDGLGYFYDGPPLTHAGAGARSLTGRVFAEHFLFEEVYVGAGLEVSETVTARADVRGFVRLIKDLDLLGGKP